MPFKVGDKVYRAIHQGYPQGKGLIIGEATVIEAGPVRLRLRHDGNATAFEWRRAMAPEEVFVTPLEALENLLVNLNNREVDLRDLLKRIRKSIQIVGKACLDEKLRKAKA